MGTHKSPYRQLKTGKINAIAFLYGDSFFRKSKNQKVNLPFQNQPAIPILNALQTTFNIIHFFLCHLISINKLNALKSTLNITHLKKPLWDMGVGILGRVVAL